MLKIYLIQILLICSLFSAKMSRKKRDYFANLEMDDLKRGLFEKILEHKGELKDLSQDLEDKETNPMLSENWKVLEKGVNIFSFVFIVYFRMKFYLTLCSYVHK